MCGICGFTGNLNNKTTILQNMMNVIKHRGPDGSGTYFDDDISLGFRRLAIIDLNNGSQPMFNEDRSKVIVFNGEIYNYKELRNELTSKGHVFANDSDTECILHGFEEYGRGILDRLRGMFAFAIWDIKERTLFAARDPFGIKPFYYGMIGGDLVFGSEIKSILEHPLYERKVNTDALEQYLSFQYSVLPETFFKGIFKLLPGHFMTFAAGKLGIERYFDPMLEPEKNGNEAETVDEIDDVVRNSVKAHMISDVEVGSLLSSGVDSAYVASVFGGSKTFTVGFDYEKYNEIPYAQKLSKKVGVENFSNVISTEEYWSELSKIQYYMDEPLADPSAVALYFVDREAAKHVKVVLSGEGADELFGGYNIYHEPMSLAGYAKLPLGLRKEIAGLAKHMPEGVKGRSFLIRGSKPLEERFIGNANIFGTEEREKVLNGHHSRLKPTELTAPYYAKTGKQDPVSRMQYIDMNFWLVGDILLKCDKMSMAHSLESRVPYLDREVFDAAKKLPASFKVTKNTTKDVFRKAAGKVLTEGENQKKKLGFPVPIRIWLRDDKYWLKVREAFESKAAETFFNVPEILRLLDEHKRGERDNSRKIWTIYMFLLWYEVYFETKHSA